MAGVEADREGGGLAPHVARLLGEHPLQEGGPEFLQRLALDQGAGGRRGAGAGGLRRARGAVGRVAAIELVGHALPADALDVTQRDGHVLGAKIKINLAPVVPVAARLPGEAVEAAAPHVGELVGAPAVAPLGGHAPNDVDEGVQPCPDGLQAAQARVELLHGRVLAAATAEVAEEGGFEAVGRVGEHQGVGAAVAVFHQEGLGQQRDEAALAVGHDVDGVLGVVVADHAHQGCQALGGQHEVHAPGALENGAERVAAEPVDEAAEGGRAGLPHVGQVGGGVGEGAAALAEILVEAVVGLVQPLPVAAAGTLVGGDPIPPVERDHRAVGGGADVALEEDRVRVVLEAGAVVVRRHAVAGGRVGRGVVGLARAPRHALGDALAEAFLNGLETHPHVVDPMHDDAGPDVFAGDVNDLGQRAGAEHGAAFSDDLRGLWVGLHGAGLRAEGVWKVLSNYTCLCRKCCCGCHGDSCHGDGGRGRARGGLQGVRPLNLLQSKEPHEHTLSCLRRRLPGG